MLTEPMKMWKSREWYFLMTVTLIVFGFNLYRTATHQNSISLDFVNYGQFIDPIKLHGTITKPHFIYPLLVSIASIVFPGVSYSALGMCIVLVFQLLVASILWNFWKQILQDRGSIWAASTLTLVCMIIAPVNLLTVSHGYFGYIGITVYHNPPMLISRPIALIHFLMLAGAISSGTVRMRQTMFCFTTIVIATLMKPNYATIMVPTATLLAAWFLFRRDFRLFNFIFLGTLLPAILVLAWQYHFTYVSENALLGESHVIFKPFFVYGDRSNYILLKFLLSISFPAAVLALCWKEIWNDRFYMTGFMLFVFGALQSYFLAESGARLYDGNFLWSAQIGLFLWFIVSIRVILLRFFSDSGFTKRSPQFIGVSILFALHIASGIIWYAHETIAPGMYW